MKMMRKRINPGWFDEIDKDDKLVDESTTTGRWSDQWSVHLGKGTDESEYKTMIKIGREGFIAGKWMKFVLLELNKNGAIELISALARAAISADD